MNLHQTGIASSTLFTQMFNMEVPTSYAMQGIQDNLDLQQQLTSAAVNLQKVGADSSAYYIYNLLEYKITEVSAPFNPVEQIGF